MTYLRRELSSLVARAMTTMPVVVVSGLRQAGKTTFLREDPLFRGRRYLTLDDYATLEAARADPIGLVAGTVPVIIDEAQKCPELLVAIKRAVDRDRRPGQFILSGSANIALLDNVTESLAGRALYLTLTPFTHREIHGVRAAPFLVKFLERPRLPRNRSAKPIAAREVLLGGMPPVIIGDAIDAALWFGGYEQTYLERDVRDLSQVADLVAFRNLLRIAAFRTAKILNQSELARDARLPVSTASRYLGLLEASFVMSRIAPHLRSRATRLIKAPKLFVNDSGLAAHLTGTASVSPSAGDIMAGPMWETWVHQNLAGIIAAHLPGAELTFWSVQGRHEVDFVVSLARRSIAIEVKSGSRFDARDLAGLRAIRSHSPGIAAGILAYNGTEAVGLGDDLFAIPLSMLLS